MIGWGGRSLTCTGAYGSGLYPIVRDQLDDWPGPSAFNLPKGAHGPRVCYFHHSPAADEILA